MKYLFIASHINTSLFIFAKFGQDMFLLIKSNLRLHDNTYRIFMTYNYVR